MKRKISNIILILIYFVHYIISSEYIVNQDGETCSNAPENPNKEYECTSYNTEDTACCFATIELHDQSTINKCIPVQKDARFALNYLTIFTFKDYQGNIYEDVTVVKQRDIAGWIHQKKYFNVVSIVLLLEVVAI